MDNDVVIKEKANRKRFLLLSGLGLAAATFYASFFGSNEKKEIQHQVPKPQIQIYEKPKPVKEVSEKPEERLLSKYSDCIIYIGKLDSVVCQIFEPTLDGIQKDFNKLDFVKLDKEKEQEQVGKLVEIANSQDLGYKILPQQRHYGLNVKNGRVVDLFFGANPGAIIDSLNKYHPDKKTKSDPKPEPNPIF